MLVACLALFVGMTGASYAAATIGSAQIKKNAVLSKHIKNGQVKTADLHANAVNSAKVADGSLTGADVTDGSLGGADLGIHSVGSGNLAPDSVDSSKVRDATLTGGDVADDSLKGDDIDESTLGQVPDAAKVGGKTPSAFVSSSIYKAESAIAAGTALGDGTYTLEKACNPGDVLLSGGPANIAPTSVMVESFPAPGTLNGWKVRINKNAQADNFSVVILCAQQS
jgi:hypothetical protein